MVGEKVKKNIYTITFIVLLLDQVIKNIILKTIEVGECITLIPNFFFFTNIKNTGGAWSILDSYPMILTVISFFCIIGLNYYLTKKNQFTRIEIIYLGLIMGGMLGNFIDRIIYDGVVDFIGFQFGSYQFPIFNIADITIVVGVGLILLEMIRGELCEYRNKQRKH